MLKDIASIAVEEVRELLNGLENALANRDLEKAKAAAHSIQGTLRIFQNEEASRLVNEIQDQPEQNHDQIFENARQLQPLLSQILKEIRDYHSSH